MSNFKGGLGLGFSFKLGLMAFICLSCAPTVKVQAPDKPIVINLNISIEHRIKVQIDKELDKMMENEKGLF